MKALRLAMQWWIQLVAAFQFLTRIPMPQIPFAADTLAGALKFFPLVGLVLGSAVALIHPWVVRHTDRSIAALIVLFLLVAVTGCLHEDGLADTADGLLGGSTREKRLTILRDSRIGSYGAAALSFALGFRWLLLASLPLHAFTAYMISAAVLSRWTVLPLSMALPPAQADGQGARVAGQTGFASLVAASVFALLPVFLLLRERSFLPLAATAAVTLLTGAVYRNRLGGVTGDCFGATIQLTEIVVYFCGVWHA